MSAPFLISIFTTSLCPFRLAMYRGVAPFCVRGIVTNMIVEMNIQYVTVTS